MNGFSLLIAVVALGVDVGWEAGPGGQTYYTVHIENLLLGPLREGQAIVSNVDANDRNLTRFQILVGEHAHAITSQPGPSGADMVQHGWRPGENGGTDYLIQISPERLESLAKGSPIVGQIDPQVTDIRKLYVFSGTQQLPQQLAPSSGPPVPPKFLGAGGGLRTASGETTQPNNSPTRVGAPQFDGARFNGTQFNGAQTPAPGRGNDFPVPGSGAYTGSTGGPAKAGGTGAAPTFNNRQPASGDWRTSNQPPTAWPNGTATGAGTPTGTGGRFTRDDRMLPVPQLPNTPQPGQGGYGGGPVTDYRQPNPPYGAGPATYGAATPAAGPNVDSLIAQAKLLGAAEAKAAAAEAKAAAELAAKPPTVVAATTETKQAEDNWPLILTTLMLFTSMAINVFLGWLAWSFFWRFRDAAGDATRAQTTLFPTRQAA